MITKSERLRFMPPPAPLTAPRNKRVNLEQLLYTLAFDNRVSAEIEDYMNNPARELPEIDEIRKWAKRMVRKLREEG